MKITSALALMSIILIAALVAQIPPPLPASATVAKTRAIAVPPLQEWQSGDTHAHFQTGFGPYLSLSEVQAQGLSADLDYIALQVIAHEQDIAEYLSFAPLITGAEVAPGIQYGFEVSGFPASEFGHLQALNVADGFFPTDALYSTPILDFCNQDPLALTGFAHIVWLESYAPAPLIDGQGAPYMAPIEAAVGAIDFVETLRVGEAGPGVAWYGMYDKLLNAGLRPSIVGGSDNTCVVGHDSIGDTATNALVEGTPSFAAWCEALRAGRTVVFEPGFPIDLQVAGVGIGGQVDLAAPGVVEVTGDPATLLIDGVPVGTVPGNFGIGQSCWLASRTLHARTAAIYVVVADEPIAVEQDTQYWLDYCDSFAAGIGIFQTGPAEPAILARIAAARQVYAALHARAIPWPADVVEYGQSTQACDGPISAGVVGSAVDCVNAPSGASGYLLVGTAPASTPINGITLLVNLGSPYVLLPVTATQGGYCKVLLSIPSGKHYYAQFIWTQGCPGQLAASDGMSVITP